MKKENKEKLRQIPTNTLKELDDRDGVTENFPHLDDPLDKYLRSLEPPKPRSDNN